MNPIKNKSFIKKFFWGIIILFVWFFVWLLITASLDIYIHLFISDTYAFYLHPPQWYFQWQDILRLVGLIIATALAILIGLKKVGKKFAKTLGFIFLLLFIFQIFRFFIFQPFTFKGHELEPYIKDNQYIVIQKINKTIKRGDIVALKSSEGKITFTVVFALPGEKVAVENGILYINDKPLKEILYNWDNCFINSGFIIPEGYFLYGSTNINCSFPQFRISGWVMPKSRIIGKLIFKF